MADNNENKGSEAPPKDTPAAGKEGTAGGDSEEAVSTTEWLRRMMARSLGISGPRDTPEKVLTECTLDGVIDYIKSGKCKNVITMAGAGISTSAGIPDFRSPGTGLYDNLQKYNLPSPQAIFDISFFRENPEPFFQLAKELWPGSFKPTPCHYFIRLLHEHGILLRHFTQNIDTLERVAGLESDKIVEAHGTFHSSHCLECGLEYTQDWMKDRIFKETTPHCDLEDCEGVVKPDIVFFGEALPPLFARAVQEDLPKCDLLIIMGTSLAVQPFASLSGRVPDTTPRLLLNLEKPMGAGNPMLALLGMGHGLEFDSEENYRDVFLQSKCDEGCELIADKLGWKDELKKLVTDEHARIDKESTNATGKQDAGSVDANEASTAEGAANKL